MTKCLHKNTRKCKLENISCFVLLFEFNGPISKWPNENFYYFIQVYMKKLGCKCLCNL